MGLWREVILLNGINEFLIKTKQNEQTNKQNKRLLIEITVLERKTLFGAVARSFAYLFFHSLFCLFVSYFFHSFFFRSFVRWCVCLFIHLSLCFAPKAGIRQHRTFENAIKVGFGVCVCHFSLFTFFLHFYLFSQAQFRRRASAVPN